MSGRLLDLNAPPEGEVGDHYVLLQKDNKPICRTRCCNFPYKGHSIWTITEFRSNSTYLPLNWPRWYLYPEHENSHQKREWGVFLRFLWKNKRVAVVNFECCSFYILAPDECPEFTYAIVLYKMLKACLTSDNYKTGVTEVTVKKSCQYEHLPPVNQAATYAMNLPVLASSEKKIINGEESRNHSEGKFVDNVCLNAKTAETLQKQKDQTQNYSNDLNVGQSVRVFASPDDSPQYHYSESPRVGNHTNLVKTHPSFLQTLGQTHSGWIFGAIAELVDNARDANATRLDIKIKSMYSKKAGREIPVMSVIDDGCGMSHVDIVRMLSFGHAKPDIEDSTRIGRFGIGFKTGTMRLGKDALVLTQTSTSRSVALLSQTYNEKKEDVEIPIITYRKKIEYMEVDSSIQSEESAAVNLKAIKEVSPFDEYVIGLKLGLFGEKGTGTQIYIWNLEKWGSNYTLEWGSEKNVGYGPREIQNDILIRSRRVRSRPGQISQKVPLDYSLHSYLEVIFLNPRMKIYVQDSPVKSRPLARYLNKTVVEKGQVMGKTIQLTIGKSQLEWERVNGGIFMYWHGRLIEAYKRVGSTIYNTDMGRGVLGVVDVTNVMDYGDGRAWVLNNKQGFQDCEAYAILEEWLGNKINEYWDECFDKISLDRRRGNETYKPDHEWVQCDSCRKWRMLTSGFTSDSLPSEWFCQLAPFNGKCETPEQQQGRDIVTVGSKRSGFTNEQNIQHKEKTTKHGSSKAVVTKSAKKNSASKGEKPRNEFHVSVKIEKTSEDGSGVESFCSSVSEDDIVQPTLKRLRRGLPRGCKP